MEVGAGMAIAPVQNACLLSRQALPPHSKGLLKGDVLLSIASTGTQQPGISPRPEGVRAWEQ